MSFTDTVHSFAHRARLDLDKQMTTMAYNLKVDATAGIRYWGEALIRLDARHKGWLALQKKLVDIKSEDKCVSLARSLLQEAKDEIVYGKFWFREGKSADIFARCVDLARVEGTADYIKELEDLLLARKEA